VRARTTIPAPGVPIVILTRRASRRPAAVVTGSRDRRHVGWPERSRRPVVRTNATASHGRDVGRRPHDARDVRGHGLRVRRLSPSGNADDPRGRQQQPADRLQHCRSGERLLRWRDIECALRVRGHARHHGHDWRRTDVRGHLLPQQRYVSVHGRHAFRHVACVGFSRPARHVTYATAARPPMQTVSRKPIATRQRRTGSRATSVITGRRRMELRSRIRPTTSTRRMR